MGEEGRKSQAFTLLNTWLFFQSFTAGRAGWQEREVIATMPLGDPVTCNITDQKETRVRRRRNAYLAAYEEGRMN